MFSMLGLLGTQVIKRKQFDADLLTYLVALVNMVDLL